jgi:hypothetical protein
MEQLYPEELRGATVIEWPAVGRGRSVAGGALLHVHTDRAGRIIEQRG